MLEVLIFAFSISIDAFGYSLGFGARKIKLKFVDFLLLNFINIFILSTFLIIFPGITFLYNNPLLEHIGSLLLLAFGIFYVTKSFLSLFIKKKEKLVFLRNENNTLLFSDLLILMLVFVFENLFSTFVFYSNLGHPFLFVIFTFMFHLFFFLLGFSIGNKIVKVVNIDTSFISGMIFLSLSCYNLLS